MFSQLAATSVDQQPAAVLPLELDQLQAAVVDKQPAAVRDQQHVC
jgi:hypothetical protein